MTDGRFPVRDGQRRAGRAAREEVDITNSLALRSAVLDAAAHGYATLGGAGSKDRA